MKPGLVEKRLWREGYKKIAGVDEAGRGPLAGPVVAAAVILPVFPKGALWEEVRDSKLLKYDVRERLFKAIRAEAIALSVAVSSNREIDKHNILKATLITMSKAVGRLRHQPEMVLVDGNRSFPCPVENRCIVGGDGKILSIAAASIVAKVVRDRIMTVYARKYPCYGFERNRGYPTREHRNALANYGACPIHRNSFRLLGDRQKQLFGKSRSSDSRLKHQSTDGERR
ncbi:ribonuclease HII [Acidobacteriota bacterium]